MSFLRHSFPRTAVRQRLPQESFGLQSPRTNSNRRCFATQKDVGQASNSRWMLVSLGLGIPIAFYLWQSGGVQKPSYHPTKQPRGANQEYIQYAEGNENGKGKQKEGEPYNDEPRAMGPPGPVGSMSCKQEGLDNGDAMNPFVNEPRLSKKGEGETDSIKLKGTVRVDRRPA